MKNLENVILVPSTSLQTGPSGQFVYVVKADSTVEVRQVSIGISDGTNTVVKTGLQAGDRVVTDGVDHLRAGSKVTIPDAKTADTSPVTAPTTPPAGTPAP